MSSGQPAAIPALQRGDGAVRLHFDAAAAPARLVSLYQSDPGRALFPAGEAGDPLQVALLTTSGGLAGGDRLALDLRVDSGAAVAAIAQAAEKIYRSDGAETRLSQHLRAGAGAWAEWLPQETILFDGARLRRQVEIDLDPAARLLMGDILVFGRIARGERFAAGSLADRWDLRRGGRLVWTDRLKLTGDIPATLGHPAGFGEALAQGMILYATPDAAACLEPVRATLAEQAAGGLHGGATLIEGVLLVRLLDADPARLRRAFGRIWTDLRAAAGWRDALPRLWRI